MMLAVTAGAFLLVTWIATKGAFLLPSRVSDPLKATVEASHAGCHGLSE